MSDSPVRSSSAHYDGREKCTSKMPRCGPCRNPHTSGDEFRKRTAETRRRARMQRSPLYQRADHDSSERPPPNREPPFSSNRRSSPGKQDGTFLFSRPACLTNEQGAARAVHKSRGAKRKQGSPALRRFRVEQSQARPTVFHETRVTRHESLPKCLTQLARCSPCGS